ALELVHAYVVVSGATELEKVIAPIVPLQTPVAGTAVTVGIGLTVIVKFAGVPGQRLAVGVTVTVATTGAVPALVPVNEGIEDVDPLAARPIVVLLFVHA